MLPLNLATDDGPIFVNAKQYHGIIRRRKSRAKAVLENKMTRKRKVCYLDSVYNLRYDMRSLVGYIEIITFSNLGAF